MFRKRRRPTPHFQIPPPFNPITGEHDDLQVEGVIPYCAMMQVAAEDQYDDYVVCRGFDPRILRFVDYEAGNPDKPGISVAKPHGSRGTGKYGVGQGPARQYRIGEIFPAFLPTQGNDHYMPPSPRAVEWRIGQNPGVAEGADDFGGHPEELGDRVSSLVDHNDKVVSWMLIHTDTERHFRFEVVEAIDDTTYSATVRQMNGEDAHVAEILDPDQLFEDLSPGTKGLVFFQEGEYYIVPAGGGGTTAPKIRFKVKDKMVNRQTTVYVDKLIGNALDPDTLEPLGLGDEVVVHDPQNLWSQVEPDALGWAFWRNLPYGPESDDPANVPRWEIEECSLPVDELRGYLVDCMGKCDASATVTILDPKVASSAARPAEVDTECNSDNGPQWHAIRSGYANSDQGPNVTFSSGTANITAWNRHKLDGMKGSSVVLKRVTNRIYSEPDNVESPLARSDTSYEYEIVLVERRKARWIFGTWADSGSHQIEKYWDGDNPEDCGSVTITSLVGLECPLDGEKFIACFDPEADQYYLIATQSAWLGPPETVQAIATESDSAAGLAAFEATDCSVKLTYETYKFKAWPCGLGGGSGEAFLPTQEVALGTCIETQGYNLYLNRSMVCVLGVDTASPCVIEGNPCDEPPDCNYGSGV